MSLINDALKRASSQAQNQLASAPLPETAPMRPVEIRDKSLLPVVLSVLLIVILTAAAGFFWKWASVTQQTIADKTQSGPIEKSATTVAVVAQDQKPETARTETAHIKSAPPVANAEEPVPVHAVAAKTEIPAESQPIESNAELIASAAPQPEPKPAAPSFPELKLHGIFFNPVNPAAVINRRTFSVGGVISGARIVKIEQEAVTVEWNGETRVLELTQ